MEAMFVRVVTRLCPVTHLYTCSDGGHLLVTVKEPAQIPSPPEISDNGVPIIIKQEQAPTGTDVFRSDPRGRVLDADGDPSNGMTPMATFGPGTTYAEALSALGYILRGEMT